MSEQWYQRYKTEKGQVEVKDSGRQLILRRGILLVRDSGCVRILNNTNQWFTYDRGAVVNEGWVGAGFQKIDTYKVNPGNEARLCAPYGIAAQDHALYNLELHNTDPIPNWSGGTTKFINDLKVFWEKVGQVGQVGLAVGVLAVVGLSVAIVAKKVVKKTPAGMLLRTPEEEEA